MTDLGDIFTNPNKPSEKLPSVGQRVQVLCVKEMTYRGSSYDGTSEWEYDGQGVHGIVFWEEIGSQDEKV